MQIFRRRPSAPPSTGKIAMPSKFGGAPKGSDSLVSWSAASIGESSGCGIASTWKILAQYFLLLLNKVTRENKKLMIEKKGSFLRCILCMQYKDPSCHRPSFYLSTDPNCNYADGSQEFHFFWLLKYFLSNGFFFFWYFAIDRLILVWCLLIWVFIV